MDIIAGLLALIAGLGGGAGYLSDQAVTHLLHQNLDSAEILEVRLQSTPNTKVLRGDIDRVLLAGRGLVIEPYPRIAILELETDPLSLDLGNPVELRHPLQAAFRLELLEADLNATLQSEVILAEFQGIQADLPLLGGEAQVFDLLNPAITFLANNRLRLAARLEPRNDDPPLDIEFTALVVVVEGNRLTLQDTEFLLNAVPVPQEITEAFLAGLNEALDLTQLEAQGITARVLELTITENQLQVLGFIRLESLAIFRQ